MNGRMNRTLVSIEYIGSSTFLKNDRDHQQRKFDCEHDHDRLWFKSLFIDLRRFLFDNNILQLTRNINYA